MDGIEVGFVMVLNVWKVGDVVVGSLVDMRYVSIYNVFRFDMFPLDRSDILYHNKRCL